MQVEAQERQQNIKAGSPTQHLTYQYLPTAALHRGYARLQAAGAMSELLRSAQSDHEDKAARDLPKVFPKPYATSAR